MWPARASSLSAGDPPTGTKERAMTREMLRAKIHRITVTERNVHYEGSLTLDADLMEACGMVPYEKIDVYDVDNGNRFSTYLIEGGRGSGDCCVNGAAAHLVEEGHKLILASYCALEDSEIGDHRPRVALVHDDNSIRELKDWEGAAVRIES
jgi:aspartate 1-decarboxylase